MKQILVQTLALIAIVTLVLGCGVRGKPLPPLTAEEIGRGEPTYRGATQSLKEDEEEAETSNSKKKKNASPEEQ